MSIVFVFTNNSVAENKLIRPVLFTIITKEFKYFGINSTKDVRDLYNGYHKH